MKFTPARRGNMARSLQTVTFVQIQQYACRTAALHAAFQLHAQRTDRQPDAWLHMS